ncbi:unnamed protein product [Prunus armeniaca]
MGKRQSSPKTEFRASKRCRMPEKARRSLQRNEFLLVAPFSSNRLFMGLILRPDPRYAIRPICRCTRSS